MRLFRRSRPPAARPAELFHGVANRLGEFRVYVLAESGGRLQLSVVVGEADRVLWVAEGALLRLAEPWRVTRVQPRPGPLEWDGGRRVAAVLEPVAG